MRNGHPTGHLGDTLYSPYTIYVDPSGESGVFFTLKDALDFVASLTPRNSYPCVIIVRPGTLTIDNSAGPLTVPNYCSIIGESGHSYIIGSSQVNDYFDVKGYTYFERLFIHGPNAGGTAMKATEGGLMFWDNCTFYGANGGAKGTGVAIESAHAQAQLRLDSCSISYYGFGINAHNYGNGGCLAFDTDVDQCTSGIRNVFGFYLRTSGCDTFIDMTADAGAGVFIDGMRQFDSVQILNATNGGQVALFNAAGGSSTASSAMYITNGSFFIADNVGLAPCSNDGLINDGALAFLRRFEFSETGGYAVKLDNSALMLNLQGRMDGGPSAVKMDNGALSLMSNCDITGQTVSQFDLNTGSTLILNNIFSGFQEGTHITVDGGSTVACRGYYAFFGPPTNQLNQVDANSFVAMVDAVLDSTQLTLNNSANVILDFHDFNNGGRRLRREPYAVGGQVSRDDRYVALTAGALAMVLPASTGFTHANYPCTITIRDETGLGTSTIAPPGGETLNGGAGAIAVPAVGGLTIYGYNGTWFTT